MKQTDHRASCIVKDLGLIEYNEAFDIQKKYVAQVLKGGSQYLLFNEHPAVLTMGRLADRTHLLASESELKAKQIDVINIDRGGEVTLHSPGQLVIYPILDLNNYGKDLHRFLHALEEVAIELSKGFDILAKRIPGKTGAFVGEKKIASIGIGVQKWISYHGLAINVNTDLKLFSLINPCGLDVQMTSISDIKKAPIDINDVKQKAIKVFSDIFNLDIQEGGR